MCQNNYSSLVVVFFRPTSLRGRTTEGETEQSGGGETEVRKSLRDSRCFLRSPSLLSTRFTVTPVLYSSHLRVSSVVKFSFGRRVSL